MLFFLLPKKVADKIRTHQPFYLLFQFAFGTVVLYWLAVTVIMATINCHKVMAPIKLLDWPAHNGLLMLLG